MNNTLKGILIGSTITTLLMCQIPAIAESMEVALNKIKVTVNGQAVQADNVLINGRTYVPLRAIAEILGKEVTFDQATSTAGINDKDYDPNKLNGPGYSRENPADLNTTIKCDFKSGYDSSTFEPKEYSANITVKEILRGDSAWEKIKAVNKYNDAPTSGKDYILAKIEFSLLTSPDQYDLYDRNFKLVSENGKEYTDFFSVILPDPKLDTKLYAGAKHEGYAAFLCDHTDSKPIISFGKDYNGKGGVWFKAY